MHLHVTDCILHGLIGIPMNLNFDIQVCYQMSFLSLTIPSNLDVWPARLAIALAGIDDTCEGEKPWESPLPPPPHSEEPSLP